MNQIKISRTTKDDLERLFLLATEQKEEYKELSGILTPVLFNSILVCKGLTRLEKELTPYFKGLQFDYFGQVNLDRPKIKLNPTQAPLTLLSLKSDEAFKIRLNNAFLICANHNLYQVGSYSSLVRECVKRGIKVIENELSE